MRTICAPIHIICVLILHIVIAVMNKHYSAILKSFPVDFNISESRVLSRSQRSTSKINSRISNEVIFKQLVNDVVSPDNDKTPVDLCRMLLMLIGDTPAIRELQKGNLFALNICMYMRMYVGTRLIPVDSHGYVDSIIDSIAYGHGIGNARRLYRYYPYPGCGFHFKTQAKSNCISVCNYT